MRYIFISDVHGMYYKMLNALDDVKFDKTKDTLVCLGDIFDRGPHSKEILEFIMDLPHKILVWGNHDRRLWKLIVKGYAPYSNDWHNGVQLTLDSFCGDINQAPCNGIKAMQDKIIQLKTDDRLKNTYNLLLEYFDSCVWGVEFSDLIGVHAWVPNIIQEYWFDFYQYSDNWRDADDGQWELAIWHNPLEMLSKKEHMQIGKKLIVGHIWSWRPAQKYGMRIVKWKNNDYHIIAPDELSVPREYFNVIFIDGMANQKEGKVIAYTYETDDNPQIFRKR